MNNRVLKSLFQCFIHRDNPYGNANPNIVFQQVSRRPIPTSTVYTRSRTYSPMGEIGSASSMFTADKGKQSKQGCVKDHESGQTSIVKDAIVRAINVRYRVHPDFNARGQWDRMKSDRAIRSWQKEEKEIKLTWGKRADGTHLPKRASESTCPPISPRNNDANDRDYQGNRRGDRENDRRREKD